MKLTRRVFGQLLAAVGVGAPLAARELLKKPQDFDYWSEFRGVLDESAKSEVVPFMSDADEARAQRQNEELYPMNRLTRMRRERLLYGEWPK